jgi:adenine phosphoribosyltransferase
MVAQVGRYTAVVGSQQRDLPLIPVAEGLAIALLITVDHGVEFAATAGGELAELLRPFQPDIVASVATMGIPIAIEVTRTLGLDDYLILQKTPKIHLADAIDEPVKSITTGTPQRLLFDRARLAAVVGRRVALVDDVVSTGASIKAALALLRRVGALPVAVGALVTEASEWRGTLGGDAALVHALGAIPLFRRGAGGAYHEEWSPADAAALPAP